MTIFAETERLFLRRLEKADLPRLTLLLNDWDVVRWLSVVPFPYRLKDAEEFFADMDGCYKEGDPQLYTLALKTDNLLIGAIGLHPPRGGKAEPGEVELGYWLGCDYWRQGLVTEAALKAVKIAFARPDVRMIGATTALNNHASQNILRKCGLQSLGEQPRDYAALRGDNTILRWRLTRSEYEKEQAP